MIKLTRHPLLAVALLLAGCASSKQSTTQDTASKETTSSANIASATYEAAHARWSDATMETLEQGRQTYTASCNRCHGYPEVQKYSEEEWHPIMERMGKKAKLTAEQTELVTRYVIALRASSTPR